jgi:hypothetical protein
LWNPLDFPNYETVLEIPPGWEWVGVALVVDDEGYIVWLNPVIAPMKLFA